MVALYNAYRAPLRDHVRRAGRGDRRLRALALTGQS
jgi:hypothetical protein